MSYYKEKTPILEPGLARDFMERLLETIKCNRGLTTFIEANGINGKWLKPNGHHDIRTSKLIKIFKLMAIYLMDDEFMEEWIKLGQFILSRTKTELKNPDIIKFK